MSKIFRVYTKNKDGVDIDRCWYDSSNVKYSECLDPDNELKTLTVVFKNGGQYQYEKVNTMDYMLFRDAVSQGKALNETIKSKGYEYKKIQDGYSIESLDDELSFRLKGGIYVGYNDGKLLIKDNKDAVICEREVKLTKNAFDAICAALAAVGKEISLFGDDDFFDEEDKRYKNDNAETIVS